MSLLDGSTWALACAAAFAMSALLTHASIRYARRLNLIDEPGRRRSHHVPTPRGGGIGIVVAVVACAMLPVILDRAGAARQLEMSLVTAAFLVVAAVGWIDDHRGLGRWVRFAAQSLAGCMVVAGYAHGAGWIGSDSHWLPAGLFMAVLVIAVVWSINLHNFMDGIDGLLASQAIFVLGSSAVLMFALEPSAMFEQRVLAIAAFAVLGFLPFNFPGARVFMGDVGSGALGLLVAVAVFWQVQDATIAPGTGIVLCSAFVTDATATLVLRIMRGRRWYSPHREHLYQWLVRTGSRHSRVVGWYMAWNALVVVPAVWWMNRGAGASIGMPDPDTVVHARDWLSGIVVAAPIVGGVHALALLAWVLGKRHCLQRAGVRFRGIGAQ